MKRKSRREPTVPLLRPMHQAFAFSACPRDEADEIAGTMLSQLSAMRGCVVEAVSVTSLASEMVELVEDRKADVVCISAMPPAAATHARYLCKRLQGRFPDAHLIVGLWNAKGDLTKMKERIGCMPRLTLSQTWRPLKKRSTASCSRSCIGRRCHRQKLLVN